MKIQCKDFSIQNVRIGSRLQSGPEWAYKIVYTDPEGRQKALKGLYYRKADAKKAISKTVQCMNNLIKAHKVH